MTDAPASESLANGPARSVVASREGNVAHGSDPTKRIPADASAVLFPVHPSSAGMDAARDGVLTVDDEGCLRHRNDPGDPGVTPPWPPGHATTLEEGELQVPDAKGRVLAGENDRAVLGGGGTTREVLEREDPLEAKVQHEFFERCPGAYFPTASVELVGRNKERPDPRRGFARPRVRVI